LLNFMAEEATDTPPPPVLEPRKVRRVSAKDKSQVEAISEGVYQYRPGVPEDYLPLVYDVWLQDSDRACFGLEIAGKIVGFTCRTLLDQGRTIWIEGTRIAETYRGYGLIKTLYEGVEQQWSKSPNASSALRTRWTGYLNDEERARTAGKARVLFEGTFVILAGSREQLKSELNAFEDFCEYALGLEDFEPLEELRAPDMLALLQTRQIPYVYMNWYAMETNREALRLLANGYNSFLGEKVAFY